MFAKERLFVKFPSESLNCAFHVSKMDASEIVDPSAMLKFQYRGEPGGDRRSEVPALQPAVDCCAGDWNAEGTIRLTGFENPITVIDIELPRTINRIERTASTYWTKLESHPSWRLP